MTAGIYDRPNLHWFRTLGSVRFRRGVEAGGLSRRDLADTDVRGVLALRTSGRLRGQLVSVSLVLESIETVIDVDAIDVSSRDDYPIAEVEALVTMERSMQVLNAVNDQLEYDVESFDGVPATLQVSVQKGRSGWRVDVDRVQFEP